MKIYTKTGDKGETGLFGGARVSKSSLRVACYGDVDELNSTIGVARTVKLPDQVDGMLLRIQSELFDLGAELATVAGKEDKLSILLIKESHVSQFEHEIDTLESHLTPLSNFVLPGGSTGAAHLHVARTVCRRAERHLVSLMHDEVIRFELVRYLNRLSDLLFVMARYVNHAQGIQDIPWVKHDRRN